MNECAHGNPPPLRAQHRVSFSTVDVREYDICLGDNPSCSTGVPISINWQFFFRDSIKVHEYELNRSHRAKGKELVMTKDERERILRKTCNISDGELLEAYCQVRKAQRQRVETNQLGITKECKTITVENTLRRWFRPIISS